MQTQYFLLRGEYRTSTNSAVAHLLVSIFIMLAIVFAALATFITTRVAAFAASGIKSVTLLRDRSVGIVTVFVFDCIWFAFIRRLLTLTSAMNVPERLALTHTLQLFQTPHRIPAPRGLSVLYE